jgi:hypothetical protein
LVILGISYRTQNKGRRNDSAALVYNQATLALEADALVQQIQVASARPVDQSWPTVGRPGDARTPEAPRRSRSSAEDLDVLRREACGRESNARQPQPESGAAAVADAMLWRGLTLSTGHPITRATALKPARDGAGGLACDLVLAGCAPHRRVPRGGPALSRQRCRADGARCRYGLRPRDAEQVAASLRSGALGELAVCLRPVPIDYQEAQKLRVERPGPAPGRGAFSRLRVTAAARRRSTSRGT